MKKIVEGLREAVELTKGGLPALHEGDVVQVRSLRVLLEGGGWAQYTAKDQVLPFNLIFLGAKAIRSEEQLVEAMRQLGWQRIPTSDG